MDQKNIINKPKVSVVIPVYNTEAYVEEAVRSIMNQTLSDIEIIIVNDGSTDNSLQVIEKLSKEDKRINIYSQKNKGQSEARNLGIRHAKGEYIYFMDSDDILKKEALSLSYKKSNTENLDFLIFDAICFDNIENLNLKYDRKKLFNKNISIYKGFDLLCILLKNNNYRNPVWLNLINLNFLKKNNLFFDPKYRIYEDQIFSAKLYFFAKRVSYLPNDLLYRRLRPQSLMTTPYSMKNMKVYFNIANELKSWSKDKDKKTQRTMSKLIEGMINAAVYMAHSFPYNERYQVAATSLKYYTKYISFKTWLVLFIPCLIKLKSFFKQFYNI
ncbi:MAG: glycosyltransferase [Massilibacteroides sp.]|nr:glycosyltransferase [Massilibacteroides sp.]